MPFFQNEAKLMEAYWNGKSFTRKRMASKRMISWRRIEALPDAKTNPNTG